MVLEVEYQCFFCPSVTRKKASGNKGCFLVNSAIFSSITKTTLQTISKSTRLSKLTFSPLEFLEYTLAVFVQAGDVKGGSKGLNAGQLGWTSVIDRVHSHWTTREGN